MATLELTPTTLTVRLSTAEKLAGLLRDTTIPRAQVTAARAVPDGLAAASGLRAPGLGIPGVRKIGTWRRAGRRSLVSVRRGEPALLVTLEGNGRWASVLVGTRDAEDLAAELAPAATGAGR
jgi:hypothetical protein